MHIEVVGTPRRSSTSTGIDGPGGLPVGSSGKVVSLLSGGIDSPVATLRILKRGAKAILCHFHSAPFTDLSSSRKATELATAIARAAGYDDAVQDRDRRRAAADRRRRARRAARRPVPAADDAHRRGRRRAARARRRSSPATASGRSRRRRSRTSRASTTSRTMPVLRPLIGVDKQEIVDRSAALSGRTRRRSCRSRTAVRCSSRVSPATRAIDRRVPRRRSGARHGRDGLRSCFSGRRDRARCVVKRLAIVGAGMMGEALARGLLESGWTSDDLVLVDVRQRSSRRDRRSRWVRRRRRSGRCGVGGERCAPRREAAGRADGARADRWRARRATVSSSIVAGMRTAAIEEQLGDGSSVVRAMPNTPARVGKGVTALAPGSITTPTRRATSPKPCSPPSVPSCGSTRTSSTRSPHCPVPVRRTCSYLAEALVEAGVELGLPRRRRRDARVRDDRGGRRRCSRRPVSSRRRCARR